MTITVQVLTNAPRSEGGAHSAKYKGAVPRPRPSAIETINLLKSAELPKRLVPYAPRDDLPESPFAKGAGDFNDCSEYCDDGILLSATPKTCGSPRAVLPYGPWP